MLLEVKHIGEQWLQDEDILQTNMIFKKNNSIYSSIDLLIPVRLSQKIYTHRTNSSISTIDEYTKILLHSLCEGIIFLYNTYNTRSYISHYRDKQNTIISNSIYTQNTYEIKLVLFDQEESIFFDINKFQLIH